MSKMRTCICLLLAAIFLLPMGGVTVQAEEYWPEGPQIAGDSAIVIEASTGTVLYEKNSHQQFYPASITKVMTALLATEKSGLDEDVTFSEDAVFKTEGSGIARDVGEVMTMEECLYGMMLESANECAYAIAEHTGKEYSRFITMMNKKAKSLGCKDTHFNNPHGLPDEEHWTCAYDMALICKEALSNDIFRRIVNTKRYTIPPTNKHEEETYLSNHHKMLNNYQGDEQYLYEYCIGGKTGYTSVAGSTLVTFAEKDGMALICVVMHETGPNHYLDTRTLFDYCFENFRLWNIAENEKSYSQDVIENKIFEGEDSFVGLSKDGYLVLPKTAGFEDAVPEIIETEDSPDVIGKIQYTYAGQAVGETDIEVTGAKAPEFDFQEIKDKEIVEEPEDPVTDGEAPENGSGASQEAPDAADTQTEAPAAWLDGKVFHIKIKHLILGAAGAILLVGLGFALYYVADNFYLFRYKRSVRKQQKSALKDLKFKRRWRKKP